MWHVATFAGLLSAPLALHSSFRRVQNLDPLNTASITATIYKQDGSVLIDNGSLPSGFAGAAIISSNTDAADVVVIMNPLWNPYFPFH